VPAPLQPARIRDSLLIKSLIRKAAQGPLSK
jgi:hypothetical protein